MLQTKLTDQLVLEVPLKDASSICRKAVADIGWRILGQDDMRIHCKEVAVSGMSFNWPAEVELFLSSMDASRTSVHLNGSILGFGPIQKGHLQGQPGNLRNRIEIALQEHAAAGAPASAPDGGAGSLSSELEKLAALREQGILSEEEFQTAKQRLIEKL